MTKKIQRRSLSDCQLIEMMSFGLMQCADVGYVNVVNKSPYEKNPSYM